MIPDTFGDGSYERKWTALRQRMHSFFSRVSRGIPLGDCRLVLGLCFIALCGINVGLRKGLRPIYSVSTHSIHPSSFRRLRSADMIMGIYPIHSVMSVYLEGIPLTILDRLALAVWTRLSGRHNL